MSEENTEIQEGQENQEEVTTPADEGTGEEAKEEVSLKEENPPQEPPKIEEKLEQGGFDYKALEKEYFENNGELTAETKGKLNKLGLTDEFINEFIEGKKALYEQEINDLASVVGTREDYNNLIEWTAKNVEPSIINAINSITDKNILKQFILPTLKSQMEEKEGVLPKYTAQGSGKEAIELFESQAQMLTAIKDPRYKTDTAYQNMVTAKIKASREAGINLGI